MATDGIQKGKKQNPYTIGLLTVAMLYDMLFILILRLLPWVSMPRKMNKTKNGMFPIRKKHTVKTLKKDVKSLRKNGYPVRIALHTLEGIKKSSPKKSSKARGTSTIPSKKYVKKKR